MSNISIRESGDWGICGHTTIDNRYEKLTISGDNIVVNHSTGLVWHQSGSDEYIKWDDVDEWIRNLNSRGVCRLP